MSVQKELVAAHGLHAQETQRADALGSFGWASAESKTVTSKI